MKRNGLGVVIGLAAFLIGAFSADLALLRSIGVEDERQIYHVDVATLVAEGDKFDGKVVRVSGDFATLYRPFVGNLGGRPWIRTICVADIAVCSRVNQPDLSSLEGRVEVIGRYRSHANDVFSDQSHYIVHLLEIQDVLSYELVERDDEDRDRSSDKKRRSLKVRQN